MTSHSALRVQPASADRWDDLAKLAGERGFYSGCWCMWWRVTSKEWNEQHEFLGDEFKALVCADQVPGLLAYDGDEPVGWVAVAPRSEYPRLDRSTKLKPVDDQPVWSITCFYIHRDHRRQGVAQELLAAAVEHARSQGAETVEGYPIDPAAVKEISSASIFTGTLPMFRAAGFEEVARRGGRPIVRLTLK